jgi:hypothetical protein
MKNLIKLFGIIACAALIGFALTGCPTDPEEPETVSLIGTWKGSEGGTQITFTFAEDGTLTIEYVDDDDEPHTTRYTYDDAAKKIYNREGGQEECGYYTLSGGKLTVTRLASANTYNRTEGSGGGLIGIWRRPRSGDNYEELTFTATQVTQTNSYGDDPETYTYTASGDKLTWTYEFKIAELQSNGTLNVWMDGDDPIPFTRRGSGSGVTGTWTWSGGGMSVQLTITANQITYTMTGNEETGSGEMPCRISGNEVFSVYTEEYKYSIAAGSPDVLTLNRLDSYECTKQP